MTKQKTKTSLGLCYRKKIPYLRPWKKLLTAFSLFAVCSAFAAEEILPPGGVSVDLSKVEIPEQGKPEGPNLFANGDFHNTKDWHSTFFVEPEPGLDRTAVAKQLRELSEKTFIQGENGHVYARIAISDKIAEHFQNSRKKTVLSGFGTAFQLKEALKSQQEFCISFRYRGNSTNDKVQHGFYIAVTFGNGNKSVGGWGKYNLPLSQNWRQAEFNVKAPAETVKINLSAGLVGPGLCEFGDMVIRRVPPATQKLWAELYTMESIDPSHFEMREKSAVAITIAPYGEKASSWLNLYVKLPKEIDIIGYSMLLGSPRTAKVFEKVSEDPSGILYRINGDRLFLTQGHYHWNCTLLLNNTLSADGKDRSITYYAEDSAGKTLSKTMKLVVTKGERSPAPKQFITGGYFTSVLVFDNKTAEEAFAETYASVGFNAVTGPVSPIVRNAFVKHGIKHHAGLFGVSDGYSFGIDSSKKSEDIIFKGMDGKLAVPTRTDRIYNTAICPVILYTKSPYRENVIKPHFEKVYKERRQDFISPNWEPIPFDFKGCFCDRCRDEFIRYSKLPAENVKKVWPKDVMKFYRDQWVKFRSWQHEKVIGMILEMLDELSKKYNFRVEFAPELHHLLAKENSGFGHQYKLDDYLSKIRWIVLWGPYLYYDYTSPVTQNIGYHLHVWNQAGFNMKYVTDRVKEPGKRPKLIALPNLQQPSKYYLIEPEAPAFETLTYFVHGWNGSFPYFLPIGVDNRYWNSFAKANRQIASYEDYVFDGKNFQNYSVNAISPLPKNAVASWSTIKDPDSVPKPDTSLLQSKAYRLNDKYLFAVGNFWENGECFFTLKIRGLNPEKQWHVSQPDSGKYFGSFRASELEKGITLHVGGLRWVFYVVAPEKLPGCNAVIDQKTVDSLLKERLPKITKQCEVDQEVIDGAAKREKSVVNNISDLPVMKNGDVVLCPAGQLLKVKTPVYTAMLDLNKGVILNSLTSEDGTEWAGKGALGTTRIMEPGKQEMIDRGFHFLGCEKMKNGSILVKTERRFMDGKYPKLAGLIILKNFEFSKDSVLISDTFKNGSDSMITLSASSHNFPGALSSKGKETGFAKMEGAVYSMCGTPWNFKIGNSPVSAIQELYTKSGKSGSVKNGPVIFTAPWSKISVTAAWGGNKADFLGYWGTYDMPCATFEVHWKQFALNPGATETVWVKWSLTNGKK